MRIAMAMAGLTLMVACTNFESGRFTDMRIEKDPSNLFVMLDSALGESHRDLPFDTGTVYVVANEHGDLHTYSLMPCRGGTQICGGSGHVGTVQRTLDYYVVTGAYSDRTFFLSPGGDGYLTWRGMDRDLAWN
jgi:hypothetical protein